MSLLPKYGDMETSKSYIGPLPPLPQCLNLAPEQLSKLTNNAFIRRRTLGKPVLAGDGKIDP